MKIEKLDENRYFHESIGKDEVFIIFREMLYSLSMNEFKLFCHNGPMTFMEI